MVLSVWLCRGSSVVERSPEEAGVGGSIPSRGTTKLKTPEREFLVWWAVEDLNL